jgi:hypothetical protein
MRIKQAAQCAPLRNSGFNAALALMRATPTSGTRNARPYTVIVTNDNNFSLYESLQNANCYKALRQIRFFIFRKSYNVRARIARPRTRRRILSRTKITVGVNLGIFAFYICRID